MKIIINADDFGMSKGCNYGILESFLSGPLTSTSIMMNMNATNHAIKLSKTYRDLPIGLHLNITVGKPLSECKGLTDEKGNFKKENLQITDNALIIEIQKELYAQYTKFIDCFEMQPNHIDSHHFIDQIPGVDKVIANIAKTANIKIRRYLKPGEYQSIFRSSQLLFTESKSNYDVLEELAQYKNSQDTIVEMVIHPAFIDNEIKELSSLIEGRLKDFELITGSALSELLEENNMELYSD